MRFPAAVHFFWLKRLSEKRLQPFVHWFVQQTHPIVGTPREEVIALAVD